MLFPVTDAAAESLAKRLEARHDITMRFGLVLTERDFKPWLEAASAGIGYYYWNRYSRLLSESMKLSRRHRHSSSGDPPHLGAESPGRPGPWQRRGMVVGHVQSGKTANYIGLISKAADAGYRLSSLSQACTTIFAIRRGTDRRRLHWPRQCETPLTQERQVHRSWQAGRDKEQPATFTNAVKDFDMGMATGLDFPSTVFPNLRSSSSRRTTTRSRT